MWSGRGEVTRRQSPDVSHLESVVVVRIPPSPLRIPHSFSVILSDRYPLVYFSTGIMDERRGRGGAETVARLLSICCINPNCTT